MGLYDLPATLSYIKNVTEEDKITYIGHSMGATQFFVMASEKPELTGATVKAMFSLAPAVFNYYMRGLGAYSAPTGHLFTVCILLLSNILNMLLWVRFFR